MASGGYIAGEVAQPEEKSGPLHLHVSSLDGTSFDLAVDSAHTLGDVKEKIQVLHGISPEHQALLLGRKRLEDSSSTLAALQVPDKARLTLLKLVDEESTAPFLRKLWENWFGITMIEIRFATLLESDSETVEVFEDSVDKRIEELKSSATKAFECHDSNGDGVLDEGEAAVFFLHLVEELSYALKGFLSTGVSMLTVMPSIEVKLKLWLLDSLESSPKVTEGEISAQANLLFDEIVQEVLEPHKSDFLVQKDSRLRGIVGQFVPKSQRWQTCSKTRLAGKRNKLEEKLLTLSALESTLVKELGNKHKEYTANKEERDARAFALLDKNCDGTIAMSDALDALVPGGSNLNAEFFGALGIDKVMWVLGESMSSIS